MPIDLFQKVMHHLACADLALSAPHYKDIMLVGRSGVGRRSLVSLIAHMQRLTVFSPATSRKYDDKEWKRDLKQVMQMTGIERQHSQSARRTLEQVKQQVNLFDAEVGSDATFPRVRGNVAPHRPSPSEIQCSHLSCPARFSSCRQILTLLKLLLLFSQGRSTPIFV